MLYPLEQRFGARQEFLSPESDLALELQGKKIFKSLFFPAPEGHIRNRLQNEFDNRAVEEVKRAYLLVIRRIHVQISQ